MDAENGRDRSSRPGNSRSAGFCWALLFISLTILMAFLVQLRASRARTPVIAGSWEGVDAAGERILYRFDAGGGFRFVAGQRDVFDYEFAPGYPNRIAIRFRDSAGGPPREGLVRVVTSIRIQLDLGKPGGPAPSQLSADALDLRRPPVR